MAKVRQSRIGQSRSDNDGQSRIGQSRFRPFETLQFHQQKTVCPIVSTWNKMATAIGQGTEGKTKQVETRFKKRQLEHKRRELPCRFRICKFPSCESSRVSKKGSVHGDKCHYRHVEGAGMPSKREKKGGAKGSVVILKESTHLDLGCVSQDSYPGKSTLREEGKLGSKHTVSVSKGTGHQIKVRERKGPSRGIIPKCAPHERGPHATKFGEGSHEETWQQEGCVRKVSWDFVKILSKLESSGKTEFCTFTEAKTMPAPIPTRPEEREFDCKRGSANPRGSTSVRSRSLSVRNSAITR